MRTFTAVVERDQDTGLFVGYVPGWPGAHSQGETAEELRALPGTILRGAVVFGGAQWWRERE